MSLFEQRDEDKLVAHFKAEDINSSKVQHREQCDLHHLFISWIVQYYLWLLFIFHHQSNQSTIYNIINVFVWSQWFYDDAHWCIKFMCFCTPNTEI